MSYECLIHPPVVVSKPWHWPRSDVKQKLDKLVSLAKPYVGPRLYLPYNAEQGCKNGTTKKLFANINIRHTYIAELAAAIPQPPSTTSFLVVGEALLKVRFMNRKLVM